jgi:predicted small integral membrane protein
MHLLAADRLATTKGTIMFVSLLAFSVVLASPQDIAPPVPVGRPDRYENAMRCAGVMAATSALHAFTGNAEAQARSDRNGRGFITAASVFAQPLGLTQEQLSEAFNASTARALGSIIRNPDQAAADAAIDQLNAEHNACLDTARAWLVEANGTS